MARPGVTYQDIAAAINELNGQGKNITIENIRLHLGTGSIGTINKYLRQWRELQVSAGKIASKENLPEELVALMKGLWEGVLTQSLQRFEPLEINYQQEITKKKIDLEKFRHNNQRWQKLFNQWQQEKSTLANEKLTLDQALEFSQKENQSLQNKNDGLLKQLQEKQERIDELHRLHKQTQQNLEHYRESVREQRALDQQQHDQQKQQLQMEIKNLSEQLQMSRDKLSSQQQQNLALTQSHSVLEKKHSDFELRNEKLTSKLQEAEKISNENHSASLLWKNQFNDAKKSLELKTEQLLNSQAENKSFSLQLEDLKKSLKDMQDQNKLLGFEKWEIIQEKAQLEGRLKQLQEVHND